MGVQLKIEHLSKSFQDYRALEDINFELQDGEIIGFLGPSGAGKTTTIKIVTGQLRQSSGYAELLGQDTNQLTSDIYKEIGIVSDNTGVYEKMSVYDNLKFYANLLDVSLERVDALLKRIGLYEKRKLKAEKLSRGQKQRLILIRSLLHHPKILFLDEPTSGLDPVTTLKVHKMLLELRAQGMAIFLTTHDMAEATKLCDKVALLNDGTIAEFGTPEELSMKYYNNRTVEVILNDYTHRSFIDFQSIPEDLIQLMRDGQIISIHSSEPTLEQVFLEVTGRELA